MRTAVLLTGDRGAAEDLLQDVYERVYIHWRRIRTQPEPYARKALVNASVNRWRKRSRRPTEVALAEWHDRPTSNPPDAFLVRDELRDALQALPPRQRAVVVLRYYADLSEAQTAETLGCSVGTVKSQAARALARLRADSQLSTLENHS